MQSCIFYDCTFNTFHKCNAPVQIFGSNSKRHVENDVNKVGFRGWRKILREGDAWELIVKGGLLHVV